MNVLAAGVVLSTLSRRKTQDARGELYLPVDLVIADLRQPVGKAADRQVAATDLFGSG